MPVVIGQAVLALCFLASVWRIWLIVISLPLGTFFISESTSVGAGTTNVPVPMFPAPIFFVLSACTTLGRSFLPRSFSFHDLRPNMRRPRRNGDESEQRASC